MVADSLQGFAIGSASLATIRMQNLFVINAAVSGTRRRALATSLAVTLFDMTLTLASFFGIGLLMDAVPGLSRAIQLVGGLLVVVLGVRLIAAKREDPAAQAASGASRKAPRFGREAGFASIVSAAFVVTWCNPQALIDGALMLGAFRATFVGAEGVAFVVGACSASLVWFQGIALAVNALGSRFSDGMLRVVNVVCGIVVVLYGMRLVAAFFGLGA